MGQSYLLGCPEGGDARLLDAVERVDTAMCRIRDAGKVKARDRIAVLTALNLAFDLADRGGTAPSPATVPVPLATVAAPIAANADSIDDPRLSQLVRRLDQALGGDGRLL